MKKTISYLLVFCLFAFSLFSTGCGSSSSAFKFLGAVVAIAVVASSGGAASSAIFAANVRGDLAPTSLSAAETKVKVYKLNAEAADLRGTELSDIQATLADGKLTCSTGDERLEIGDYLFEVYNTDNNKVFLRAILHVDGTSNELTLQISPVTEIKTAVYKEWLEKAPEEKSVANFEKNLTKALETAIEIEAKTYSETLATWDKAEEILETVNVSAIAIEVPTATLVTTTTGTVTFEESLPTDLQTYTWGASLQADLEGARFVQAYQKYNGSWVKLVADSEEAAPPDVFFMHYGVIYDFTQDMNDYSEQVMTTLMETASNGVATMYTQEELHILGEGSFFNIHANSTLSEDGKTLTTDDSAFGAEPASVVNYTISVGKSGSDVMYLYMKNKTNTTAVAEKIFIKYVP